MAPTHHMLEARRVYGRDEFDAVVLEMAKESMTYAPSVNPDFDEEVENEFTED